MLLDHVLSGLKIKAKLLRYFFSRGIQLREKNQSNLFYICKSQTRFYEMKTCPQ